MTGCTAISFTPQATMYAQQPPAAFSRDLFSRFIDYTDRKETTVKGYLTCIRQFANWMQDNGITQPDRQDVKDYRQHLQQAGYAVGTQQQYLGAVKHFFNWTAAEGLYPNIAENIHGAKVRNDIHKKDSLTRDAVKTIADSIDRSDEQGKRLYAMYMLCITCGLRTVEIHRANVEDIKTVGNISYLYIQGKGHDDKDAPVELIPEVKAALADYLQNREAKTLGKSPLFTSTSNRSKGGRIATTTISTMLKEMMIKAGYDSDRLTAHSLRHTSGTGAYMATGNLLLAQKHQRHADPSTTEIYVHAEERAERHTEQQVYNYYFKPDEAQSKRQAVSDLLQTLTPEQLDLTMNFIKTITKNS